jgi:hypothetical protein
MDITHITVLQSACHSDKLILHTTLAPSVWPYDEPATITIEVAADWGPDYCVANFPGIPFEVVGPN